MRLTLPKAAVAVLSFLIASAFAHADNIQTFQLEDTNLVNSSLYFAGTATGTITIDTTTGDVLSASLVYTGTPTTIDFSGPAGPTTSTGSVTSTEFTDTTDTYFLDLNIPLASLINYTGGSICSLSTCEPFSWIHTAPRPDGSYATANYFTSGSLDPTTPTPEPSTLLLLATGFLAAFATMKQHTYKLSGIRR
jgi:hypothetical protein